MDETRKQTVWMRSRLREWGRQGGTQRVEGKLARRGPEGQAWWTAARMEGTAAEGGCWRGSLLPLELLNLLHEGDQHLLDCGGLEAAEIP